MIVSGFIPYWYLSFESKETVFAQIRARDSRNVHVAPVSVASSYEFFANLPVDRFLRSEVFACITGAEELNLIVSSLYLAVLYSTAEFDVDLKLRTGYKKSLLAVNRIGVPYALNRDLTSNGLYLLLDFGHCKQSRTLIHLLCRHLSIMHQS